MKRDLDYTAFIERYVMDDMRPDERVWFEKELEGDSSLKEEVELQRSINGVFNDSDMLDFKAQLDKLHQDIDTITEQSKGAIHRVYRHVYMSAGLVAGLVIVLTMFLMNSNYSNEKILDSYYSPVKASVNFRSADVETDVLTTAMKVYNEGRFEEAVVLFEEILDGDKAKLGINLYNGIAYMEIKDYKNANHNFNVVIEKAPNSFVQSAKWYLGMCYLFTDERGKAIEQFETLKASKGYYSQDARKILRRID